MLYYRLGPLVRRVRPDWTLMTTTLPVAAPNPDLAALSASWRAA